ncbi:MAG: hypothetical protein A3D65_03505 [Candidatus Lloydbacteria bacterium RIFCSPHIGHO2_02_FULL_50_13]|uniref:Uncharacterized protein n=1 Tax=Candidatus Lloydbacteria bacterium RIFCSPHIGHO2_02_FULL_50_13 TaxID=1798661 RepID=A0A1G2D6W3_9BACT|nr:MAG: hypothetical protein A3D65_03505 [Candidatus Lloydbacteria bacterium RIFCSPHIGHO2_02_FULL_50_13]
MKYIGYILPVLIIALFAYLFFGMEQGTENVDQSANTSRLKETAWEMKTDNQGGVTVKVTPLQLSGTEWKFDIAFDTHSGSLDQDLMLIATLSGDEGVAYKPVAWEGAGPGGHHREGVLVFDAVNPMPSSVELKMKDIGGVSERSFEWNSAQR